MLKQKMQNKRGRFYFLKLISIIKNRNVPLFLICLLSITVFTACIFPAFAAVAKEAPNKEAPKEEKTSLDLKNIEVVELLRIISLKTGKTIVPSQNITGRITVFLNNVSVKDVLDIIALNQGYALEKKGNIYYIMTAAEYKALYGKDYIEVRKLKTMRLTYAKPANVFNAISQLKSDTGKIIADEATGTLILMDIPEKLVLMEKTAKELDRSLETRIYDLNYAKPADAKLQLSAAITPGTGVIIVDERSGKAIVSDLPKKMEKISELVKTIDEETRQVFIETEIVEVTLTKEFQRGINWSVLFGTGKMAGLNFIGYYPMALSAFQKISAGTIPREKFSTMVNFLETFGDAKIISQPRIAVVNNEEASIMVGSREAYVTQTLSQAETTTVTSENIEFIDVGVKLKIVPTINKDGFITMKIKPEVSTVKETLTTSLGSTVPIVQTSQAETVAKVKDGTMIMIAGLIKETKRDTIYGIPWLCKIPIVGSLFGSRDKYNQKTELIIFITPHLTRGDSQLLGYGPKDIIPEDVMPDNVTRKLVREEVMVNSLDENFIKAEEAKKQAEEAKKQSEGIKRQEEEANRQAEESRKQVAEEQKRIDAQKLEKAKQEEGRKQEEINKSKEQKKQEGLAEKARKAEEAKKQAEEAKQKAEEAKKQAEEAKKKSETEISGRMKAAEFYKQGMDAQKSGKLDEAKDYFQKAVDSDADFAIAYNQLGIVLETAGLGLEAKKMYLKAIQVDAQCKAAYSNLALLNEAEDNKEKAIEYWQKRIELSSADDSWAKEAKRHIEELKNDKR